MKSFLSKFGTALAFGAAGVCYMLQATGFIDADTLGQLLAAIGVATGVVVGGSKVGGAK